MSKRNETIADILAEMRDEEHNDFLTNNDLRDLADRLEAAHKEDQKRQKAFLWNIVNEATDGDKSEGMRLGWILASVSTALGNTLESYFAKKGAE
ncbi:MAG: hypothetical protein IJS32_09990 [Kiritimatiellae bacterium]|nr:hypothetical protein [Kiritimatiellia bacterium]